jgi:COP9 signalosome complex subunit 7
MPTIRDLEDLIIDAIYLDILCEKLGQKEQQLQIEHTMGRDLEPGMTEAALVALRTWCVLFQLLLSELTMVFPKASTTASVLSALDNKLAQIASYSATVAVDNEEHDRAYNVILKNVSKDAKKRGPLAVGVSCEVASIW